MPELRRNAPLARDAMAYVLAGGRGSRLMELTDRRAKPAVYFGGKSRIIDFALSNALNSGIRHMGVATQYKAHSLIRHLQRGWNFLRPERNESFDILPASQRVSEDQWYRGTADAVYQNADIIEAYDLRYMVVLAGDHIYKMDYELMLQQHVDAGADVTVGCLEVKREDATGFGVMQVDDAGPHRRVRREAQRPAGHARQSRRCRWPPWASTCSTPGSCSTSCAGMPPTGRRATISARTSFRRSLRTARRWPTASPPRACARTRKRSAYWRDVGTIDAYWEANLDLTATVPQLDLYDRAWPIWTYAEVTPPAKFVHDKDGRRGMAVSSLVSGGCIVSGASLRRSLLFTGVHVHSYPRMEEAVVMPYVDVGPRAKSQEGGDRSRRRHPGWPGRRRRSGARRQALPAHRKRACA